MKRPTRPGMRCFASGCPMPRKARESVASFNRVDVAASPEAGWPLYAHRDVCRLKSTRSSLNIRPFAFVSRETSKGYRGFECRVGAVQVVIKPQDVGQRWLYHRQPRYIQDRAAHKHSPGTMPRHRRKH